MKAYRSPNSVAVLVSVLSLLTAFSFAAAAQARLTPDVNRAAPGATIRLTVNPVIGMRGEDSDETRVVLRTVRVGSVRDLELRMLEYHGAWLLVEIPADAPNSEGRLLWLDRSGDTLASSRGAFQIVSRDMPQRDGRPGDVDGRKMQDGKQSKQKGQDIGRDPEDGVQLEGKNTTGRAQRLKTPVVDYLSIQRDEIEVRGGVYPVLFNLPSDVRLDGRGVLTFVLGGEEVSGPGLGSVRGHSELNIKINDREVESITLASYVTRAWTVTFDAGVLQRGRNRLVLTGGGEGIRIKVKDTVLWFHRDIAW